jgi:putative hydrolase of HD superfamily
MALLFADAAPTGTSLDRVRDLLVIHDLVEIHAGDTVIWDNVPAADIATREAEAATRLFDLLPEPQRTAFTALNREFALQQTVESRFARALDALHPMIMSWGPSGIGHPRLELTPSVVLARKHQDIGAFPSLWSLAEWLVSSAVERGLMLAEGE